MECKKEKNLKSCNCTCEPCPRKGVCCDCLHYHRVKGQLPACYFPDEIEKSRDRSIGKFVETYLGKGCC